MPRIWPAMASASPAAAQPGGAGAAAGEPAGLADPVDGGGRLRDRPDEGIVDAERRQLVEEFREPLGVGVQAERVSTPGSRVVEPNPDRSAHRPRVTACRTGGGPG